MNALLNTYHEEIVKLCHEYNVNKLYAFGSVLRDDFNDNSDIDFVVDFNQIPLNEYADNYFDLKFSLEDVFKRKIDLLEDQAIKNPYFKKELLATRQLIYG